MGQADETTPTSSRDANKDALNNSDKENNVDAALTAAGGDKKTDTASPTEPQYVTGVKQWLVVLALSLTLFVTMLDMSVVSTVCLSYIQLLTHISID